MSTIQIGLPEHNAPKKTGHRSAHTDIFGNGAPDVPTPKKNAPASTLQNPTVEETDGGKTEDKKPQKEKETENGQTEQPAGFQRVRMPPGGFSSALW